MVRKKAWTHYFETGDRTPLVKAYWKSIQYIAWEHYRHNQEDMFQVGMLGLLKAIDRLDRDRVKSLDAWVFLKVRSAMMNVTPAKVTYDVDALYETPSTSDEYDLGLLDGLPKREALILRLVHVENYKRTEVAKMFGLSSMRIGQLEKRALQNLKDTWTGGEVVNTAL